MSDAPHVMIKLPARLRWDTYLPLAGAALLWVVSLYCWMARITLPGAAGRALLAVQWISISLPLIPAAYLLYCLPALPRLRQALAGSLAFLFLWPWCVFTADMIGLVTLRVFLVRAGIAASFLGGLGWAIWAVERASRYYFVRRQLALVGPSAATGEISGKPWIWNPLDEDAWYYGQRGKKLNQSLTTLMSYSLLYFLLFLLLNNLRGCRESYLSPAGGGEQQTVVQQVKIQKVEKKKYVINPFSLVKFNPPPLEEVQLNLLEATKHFYKPGQGQGEGAGFEGGSPLGEIRFIRLEYGGGNWNNRSIADENMLIWYQTNLPHKTASRPESRTIKQLANFVPTESPPVVYLNGSRNLRLSKNEVDILQDYLLNRHGMIFADASGDAFHGDFLALMGQVLPQVRPVPIQLDDAIHRVPFQVPLAAYVTPRAGNQPLGWKVDGRWVVYYHPGDIGDAWMDDHAGVPRRVYEACFQISANVIFYAHAEHSRWITAQQK